ncbi:MAG: NADH-quinone oxidoreductase subunit B family protein [Thermodesulfobacteriota bacterium]
MFRLLHQIFKTGLVTEPLAPAEDSVVELVGARLEKSIMKRFRGSLTIRMVDSGSCNACELEAQAINNPIYNAERFGIHFTASPRFADMLLVSGPVARNMEIALRRTYESMPAPKLVVAIGDCARDGGIFGKSYASLGGVNRVIPVDAYIAGCPPEPSLILGGILKVVEGAVEPLRKKY